MNTLFKRLISLIIFLLVSLGYIVWPFDLMPGIPVDDVIVAIIATVIEIINQRKITQNAQN